MDFNNEEQNNQLNNGNPSNEPGQNPAPYGTHYVPPNKQPGNGMANAAMILGIGAILTAFMFTVYFPFVLGSLSIILALLSKSRNTKMIGSAKAGVLCGSIGLAVNITIILTSINYVLSNPAVLLETAKQYDNIYENVYGVTSEELFGDSLENIVEGFISSED